MQFQSIYPYTQEIFAEYEAMDAAAIDAAITRSQTVFHEWSKRSGEERSLVLQRAALVLKQQKEALGRLITREMGKTLAEAIAEVEKCAWVCEYYATEAAHFLQDEIIQTDYSHSRIRYQPIGTVLAIMPWNFPFWQVFRFAAPTLMAGNAALLKHASNVCGCALAIQTVFEEAGAPAGLFQTLLVKADTIGTIIQHDAVQALSLTGSEQAGVSVAALAGAQIKKSVLELGGSDAFVVLADADIALAAKTAVQARMQNAGQSCIAAKRFIVAQEVYDAFVEASMVHLQAIKRGDPLSPDTTMGVLARPDLAETLQIQLEKSMAAGAKLLQGGSFNGCDVAPILLGDVLPGMPAFEEETFGPLMAVTKAIDEAHALQLANQSRFGLGSSVWSQNTDRAFAFADQLAAGAVFVNSMVKSDPRLPFGGIKKSGYGRELSAAGIREFVNVKTMVIR
ncbi:MAG TPA: NAD-dependent succinate-semialdehyde dehydrogenase [Flavihumibacter sp.]|nr:NAD-dependent succinate-semialdehyde dehydrogenase [Bacteroidota bacterium]HOA36764.1 NAD-dependent succinate-semialdehyde dehydrogenase [Flavihumibacter sp.]HPZ87035.1 NAD-dependent succinate-semialdehyde dehydrogenase [Flavihumibacter sp.]